MSQAKSSDQGATLLIERTGSGIRQPKRQKQTLVGLGLGHKRLVRRKDTPEMRAMVKSIGHLVRIVEGG